MKLLVDTQAMLWFVDGHEKLSAKAHALLTDPANDLLVGAGSLWEIAIKVRLGKLTLAAPYDVFIRKAIGDNAIHILPFEIEHGAMLTALPLHHRDPFDRLLAAQAIVGKLSIVSSDTALDSYGITRLW